MFLSSVKICSIIKSFTIFNLIHISMIFSYIFILQNFSNFEVQIRSWVVFQVGSLLKLGSYNLARSKLGPILSWVLFEVESFEVGSFEVLSVNPNNISARVDLSLKFKFYSSIQCQYGIAVTCDLLPAASFPSSWSTASEEQFVSFCVNGTVQRDFWDTLFLAWLDRWAGAGV